MIRQSVAHLLTPPCPKGDRRGWAAVQLEHPPSGDHLLFAYRLDDGSSTKTFRLRNLDASATYQVVAHAAPDATEQRQTGIQLISEGLRIDLPQRYRAAVYVMTKH